MKIFQEKCVMYLYTVYNQDKKQIGEEYHESDRVHIINFDDSSHCNGRDGDLGGNGGCR